MITAMVSFQAFAQTEDNSKPMVIEVTFILPERGMEEKFEEAVKAHNEKYHPSGPYFGWLHKIEYGKKAGWYYWVMGPTSYGSLDTKPGKENGHDDDWKNTVDPLIQEYGPIILREFNTSLSFGLDIVKRSKHYEVWGVYLKPDQDFRLREIARKLKRVYEKIGDTGFLVFENKLPRAGWPDVELIWSFDSFDDWQNDPGPKATFEEIYGEGSWQELVEEWKDIVADYSTEIRSVIN